MENVYSQASTAMVSSFEGIATEMVGMIGDIAPVCLPILGVVLMWKFGAKFFKGFAKA